jgi:uncharacterized membrane protein
MPPVPFDAELFYIGLCLIHPYARERMSLKGLMTALQTRLSANVKANDVTVGEILMFSFFLFIFLIIILILSND